MTEIKNHLLFVPEFQKKKSASSERVEKRARLLQTVSETAGILRKYPEAAKELHAIAGREGEEDREGTQL